MNPLFGKEYADQYDLLYGDKDYEAECDLLEKVFRLYSSAPVKTILDLGCGTGNQTSASWSLAWSCSARMRMGILIALPGDA